LSEAHLVEGLQEPLNIAAQAAIRAPSLGKEGAFIADLPPAPLIWAFPAATKSLMSQLGFSFIRSNTTSAPAMEPKAGKPLR